MKKSLSHQFLMLVFLLCAVWQHAAAQNMERIITFNTTSATLEQFIAQVKSQAGLEFTFDKDVNAIMSKKITIHKKTPTVSEALKWLTADLAVRYKVIDNYVILNMGKDKPASSGHIGRISGKIIDETQEPLPGATITLAGTGNLTTSAIDGTFSFAVPADAYTLEVSLYLIKRKSLKILLLKMAAL